MTKTQIIPYHMDSDDLDMLSFERGGAAMVTNENNGSKVLGLLRTGQRDFTPNMHITGEHLFPRVTTRRFLDRNGHDAVEALIVHRTAKHITRVSIIEQEEATPLDLCIDPSEVTCMRPSLDGRYLAIGNARGAFEVWNMDEGKLETPKLSWQGPSRFKEFAMANQASINDMCFSCTNMEFFVAQSDGTLLYHDERTGTLRSLNFEDSGWPCYSIDCQPEGNGVAFGGEDPVIWFLRVSPGFWANQVPTELNPFEMVDRQTIAGESYWTPAAMPNVGVSCLLTGVGSYVKKVQFLTNSRIAVFGPVATEIWDIAPKVRLVNRREHDPDCRLLDMCGNSKVVRVALSN